MQSRDDTTLPSRGLWLRHQNSWDFDLRHCGRRDHLDNRNRSPTRNRQRN